MKGYKRVADLMKALAHPIRLQILEVLEIATDKCEDVANILESVVLKSA